MLVDKWGIEELPDFTFAPASSDEANSSYIVSVSNLEIPAEREVLLLFFEQGRQEQDYLSDWAIITDVLREAQEHPKRTVRQEITDVSGVGPIALFLLAMVFLGLLFVFAIVWLIVVMSRKQQQAN